MLFVQCTVTETNADCVQKSHYYDWFCFLKHVFASLFILFDNGRSTLHRIPHSLLSNYHADFHVAANGRLSELVFYVLASLRNANETCPQITASSAGTPLFHTSQGSMQSSALSFINYARWAPHLSTPPSITPRKWCRRKEATEKSRCSSPLLRIMGVDRQRCFTLPPLETVAKGDMFLITPVLSMLVEVSGEQVEAGVLGWLSSDWDYESWLQVLESLFVGLSTFWGLLATSWLEDFVKWRCRLEGLALLTVLCSVAQLVDCCVGFF